MVELEHTREMVMIGVELCLSPPKKTFGSLIEETGQCMALQMKKTICSWMVAIWFQMVDFHYLTPPTKKTSHFFLFEGGWNPFTWRKHDAMIFFLGGIFVLQIFDLNSMIFLGGLAMMSGMEMYSVLA